MGNACAPKAAASSFSVSSAALSVCTDRVLIDVEVSARVNGPLEDNKEAVEKEYKLKAVNQCNT